MPLLLPHETRLQPRPRLLGAVLAVAAVVGLCALGCATPRARPPADEGAAFVERGLRREGLRFGTDGSTRALWGYLSSSHRVVPPANARPGDVLFFDLRPDAGKPSCAEGAGHAGIVEAVSPEGRITFVEARGGRVRQSFADPARPTLRRDDRGEIANTFLRRKQVDDPAPARYFAGEMLCGVARPRDN
jgi:hypothetical protein